MKTIALISLAWMLISPPASALTPVADGFNSNLIDPARWELAQFQNAKFKAARQRVNFFISPKFDADEDYAYLELRNNQPGFNEHWQVTLTVNNESDQGDRIGAGFWIYNADDPSDVIFFEFYGHSGPKARKCAAASFVLNGTTMKKSLVYRAGNLTKAKLRIVFNAKTKLFTFRIAPMGKPVEWQTLGTFSPTGGNGDIRANWNLNPGGGRFGIRLEGYGEQRLLEGGLVFMDNFNLNRP